MTALVADHVTDTGACGTGRGYQRHHRAGTPACAPCLDAARAESLHMDEARFTAALAEFIPTRPDLAGFTSFGATHFAGLVMGA